MQQFLTMYRTVLRDDQWGCTQSFLSGKASDCGATAKDNRQFLKAVI